jgi:hypothetical protein
VLQLLDAPAELYATFHEATVADEAAGEGSAGLLAGATDVGGTDGEGAGAQGACEDRAARSEDAGEQPRPAWEAPEEAPAVEPDGPRRWGWRQRELEQAASATTEQVGLGRTVTSSKELPDMLVNVV